MKNEYKNRMDMISPDKNFEEETILLLQKIKRKKSFDMNLKKSTKIIICVAIAAVLFAGSSIAAVKLTHLTPNEVAEEIGNKNLFEAFSSDSAFLTEQSFTGKNTENNTEYTVNFYGAVRGNDISQLNIPNDLSDFDNLTGGEFNGEDYYFIFSTEHTNGSAWSVFEDGIHPIEFGVFVDGHMPWLVNSRTMGDYVGCGIIDDVCYYIVGFKGFDSENIRIFAYEGIAPSGEKFLFDEATGKISINEKFKGFITEFEVPDGLRK